jgi:hypothetical protein
MIQKAKAAFIAAVPDGDLTKQRSVLTTDSLEVTTVFVKDREQAAEVANQLADQGYKFIELWSSFGYSAAGKIAEAMKGKAMVGVVRCDLTATLGGKSADKVFLTFNNLPYVRRIFRW